MECPRCGKDMLKSNNHVFCSHCGYLDNGEQIHGYEEKQASDLEIYLGSEYDTIVRNSNSKSCFLLGPLYFWIRGFVFLGFFLQILEIYIWYLVVHFSEASYLICKKQKLNKDEFDKLKDNFLAPNQYCKSFEPLDLDNYSYNVIEFSCDDYDYKLLVDPSGFDYCRYVAKVGGNE